MYGVIPVFQGPIAVAMGGVDLSWLAGGVAAAAVYAVLGPIAAAPYATAPAAAATPDRRSAPVGDAAGAPEVIA
jgi:toxin CptA